MRKQLIGLCATIILSLGAFTASATPTSNQQNQIYSACVAAHILGSLATQLQIEQTCPATVAATAFTTVLLQTYTFNSLVSQRIATLHRAYRLASAASVLSAGSQISRQSGFSGGDPFNNIGIWGNVSASALDNTFSSTAFGSHNRNATIGADFMPTDGIILGGTFGYEDTDVTTPFNAGEQNIDGYTVSGYAAALLTDHISVDASLGYSNIDIDQFRTSVPIPGFTTDPFAALAAPTRVDSRVNADRWFGSVNVNGNWDISHALLSAHAGYLYSKEDHDSFSERGGGVTATVASRQFKLGQVRAGGEIGYDFQTFLEPFIGLDYIYDASHEKVVVAPGLPQPDNDRSEYQFTLGMRYFGDNGISGVVQWTGSAGRSDVNYGSFMLTLRADL